LFFFALSKFIPSHNFTFAAGMNGGRNRSRIGSVFV
jgi:hypothetical protein